MAPYEAVASTRDPVTSRVANLAALARETKRQLDWQRLVVLRDCDGVPTQWKWIENARDFSIYTKTEPRSLHHRGRRAVLAVGTVKASASEIAALLVARSPAEYARKMAALHHKDYHDSVYLDDVDPNDDHLNATDDATPSKLGVRKLVLTESSGWLSKHDEWCYLDAVYHDRYARRMEQVLTPLRPLDGGAFGLSAKTKYVHDGGFCAYHVEEQHRPRMEQTQDEIAAREQSGSSRVGSARAISGSRPRVSSRVHFYGEMPASRRDATTLNTTQQRLLRVARSCQRLTLLIRRRRLGIQALVDRNRFLPPTATPCIGCGHILMVAKLCRLCGQGVCGNCSDKYERETQSRDGRPKIEKIRVCDRCLAHVESCDYSSISDASLVGPTVVPDPHTQSNTAEAELQYLLRGVLAEAKSPERVASVMNVIGCMLDENETATQPLEATASSSSWASKTCAVGDLTRVLENLRIDTIAQDETVYRTNEDRLYRLDPGDVSAPMAENEEERLRAVAQVDIEDLSESMELQLLCDLAASRMGCSMSAISIIDRDTVNCVAANVESVRKIKLPRNKIPCSYTILENTPNLVPHPEADIRYADALTVQEMGVRFYFSFPITDANDHVIGSFCVTNEAAVEVTETKYSTFKMLADTCNKLVRVHSEQKLRQLSSASN